MKPSDLKQARPRLLLKLILLVATIIAVVGCSGHAAEGVMPPPPEVSTASVVIRDVTQWDEFSGRVEAVERVDLRPSVSGYVEKVNFVEGQTVEQGDVLFTIDSRSYRAELARAQAELSRARSQATLAISEAARAEKLAEQQAISTELAEQRRSAASEASASAAAAEAAVATARLNVEFTQVRAPISGRASRALVTAGNLVSAGDPNSVLTTLVSLEKVHVHFDADESTYQRYVHMARDGLRPDDRNGKVPVEVQVVGETGFSRVGQVDFVDNQLASSTGTIRMRALLDNQNRSLVPGLYARVRLPGSGRFRAVLVDDRAVLTDQDHKYVYVVDGEGRAQRRDVKLGRIVDGLRVVQTGLKPGDNVITDGVQKVFMPGMNVQAKSKPMQPASATPATAMN